MNALDLLKDCPFCGGKAKLITYRVAEDAMAASVKCESCFCVTAEFEDAYAPIDDARDAWNRRQSETPSEFDRLCKAENNHV